MKEATRVVRAGLPDVAQGQAFLSGPTFAGPYYYGARMLARGFFAKLGVEVRLAPTADNAQQDHLSGAKLLWLESPSNPQLNVCDYER